MQRPWKSSERNDAVKRYKNGTSKDELAQLLGRTKSSVSMMLHREGVAHNPAWTFEESEQVLRLYSQGKTYREIGEVIGRSKEAVRAQRTLIRKMDVMGTWSEKQVNALKDMIEKGHTNKEIAIALQRSVKAIEKKIFHLKIRRVHERTPDIVYTQLWKRHKRGETILALSAETGISRYAIGARWRDMGLTEPVKTPPTIREVKAYYTRHKAGERISVLAGEAGMQPKTLREWFRRANCGPIRTDRVPVDRTEVDAAIKARESGMKWKDIPAHIGSTKTVNALQLQVWYLKKKSGS